MKISEIIQSAISLADKYCSASEVEKLRALEQSIGQGNLKVVVLGDFKAGKSTLLNRLFLKRELLPTDYLEATAVPTYLSNGAAQRLCTWKRNEDGTAVLVEEKHEFTGADIAAKVTASSEEQRAKMAQQYSHVSIEMPDVLPSGITVVDTPGLDTTNMGIYTGTLIESRLADALLYVKRAKQLSAREENLIVDLVGTHQHKVPVHVVLTYSDAEQIAEAQLNHVAETIKAQLKLRGVDCGVSSFSLSAERESASPIAEKLIPADDWSWEWDVDDSSTSENADSSAHDVDSSAGNTETYNEILAFLNGKVLQGRVARVARELKPLLLSVKSAVESRLELSDAQEAEIEQIEIQKNEIKEHYLRAVEALLQDVSCLQMQFCANVECDLDTIYNDNVATLNAMEKAADILGLVKTWPETLPVQLQQALANRKSDLLRDLNLLSIKYQQNLTGELSVEAVQAQMPTDRVSKLLMRTPVWLLQVSDYLIFDIISPLPLFVDIIIRMLAEKLSLIRKVMPTNIVADAARNMAIKKFGESVRSMKAQVNAELNRKFESFNKRLRLSLSDADIFTEQESAIAAAREGVLTPETKAMLEQDIKLIAQWNCEI